MLVLVSLVACSGPGYYLQAMSGQYKLMHARQDIQTLLNDPSTRPELAARLRMANQITTFAQNVLDLPANGSYTSYVAVDGDALVWNVIVTKEFSLQPQQWCFPVAGCVPYRGFFKQDKAENSADKLIAKGMDVLVSPAAAYSSLGWFSDPLLSTMFSGSDTRLAAYLFHELAHLRVYRKDAGMFNEAYASFVEKAGVTAWLESRQQGHELQRWLQLESVGVDFADLISEIKPKLSALYQSDLSESVKRRQKADIFSSLTRSYEKMVEEKWLGKSYYKSWFNDTLNNAKIALFDTYEGGQCAFQRLWDQAAGEMKEFHRLVEHKSRLKTQDLQNWLNQSCELP